MGTTTAVGVTTSVGTVGGSLDGTTITGDLDTDTVGDTDTNTETASATVGDTDTSGGSLWCVDADGDGFGDPTICQQSDEPIPGSVEDDTDCDDGNDNTFPGAAPNDDRRACIQDEDGDEWGDDGSGGDLPPGVMPGSDCVDDDATVFPGAADQETPPDLCAQDEDGDGLGDTDPPPGADPGSDCADDDENIFPGAAEQEPELCAEDNDDDGWGDFDPPPGVDPGNDCDDGNVYTFPGAAPNDDAMACMQDEDDDDWGDDTPPADVDAGTDCDDTNPAAFPGASPNETPPDLCTVDSDGDGWGDANPGGGGGGGPGPVGGSDCYDGNADLNPDRLQLTAFVPYNGGPAVSRQIVTVDTTTAALAPFVVLQDPMGNNPNLNLVTATLSDTGLIYTSDLTNAALYVVDYAATCALGTGIVAPVGMPYGTPGIDIVGGLEYASDGSLYGIDNDDMLITFDPAAGQEISAVPITFMGGALNISSVGTAYDCAQNRMLVANGIDWSIYSIDTVTGEATLLRDLDPYFGPAWTPVGLAWDPVSRTVYLSTGTSLYNLDIDDPAALPVYIGIGGEAVSNLAYTPVCSP